MPLLIPIELLEDQMQKQINVDSGDTVAGSRATPSTFAEEIHKLVVVELRLEEAVQRHLGESTGDHHGALGTLDLEDTRLVAGDGDVHAVPLSLVVSRPGDEDALLGQVAGGVFEGTEAVLATAVLEFTLVVVLAGEGKEELLLALLRLQRYHGLFDVVVVGLELRL